VLFKRKPKKEDNECRRIKRWIPIQIKAAFKDLGYDASWVERYLVEPLKSLGFDIPKPDKVDCRVDLPVADKLNCYEYLFYCLWKKEKQALNALKERRYQEAARLTGECLYLIDQIRSCLRKEICID